MTSLTDGRREQDDSGEYSDASQDIEISGNDGGQHESDYDSQGSDSERSEGDPEKQETERRVDDDEDRSNPQYIPKRGTFYEHDDRTAASGEESTNTTSEAPSEKKEGPETPTERRRPPRKSESLNKWSHDKYNENEQMPKSRDELVAIYGYDIRNEDTPPHARRNRRYGRGPNKYTRTWEDEDAYRRQVLQTPPNRKPLSPADFPELSAANRPGRKSRARPRSKSQPASNDSSESGSQLRRNASIKTPKQKPVKQNTPKTAPKQINRMADKLTLENLTITTNVNNQGPPQRKVNAVAQMVPVPTNQSTDQGKKKLLPTQPPPSTQHAQSNAQKQQKPQQRQQQNATGGAENRGGSKRYSSLRQRPLAETYSPQQPQQPPQQQQQQPPQTPPAQPSSIQQTQPQPTPQQQPQQQHRYHGEFAGQSAPLQPQQHQGSPAPQIHQQMIHPQVHRNAVNQPPHGPSPPHQPIAQPPQHTQQQVRLGIIEQQQMVSHPHHTMHNMPQPHQIGQIQQSQGYAPPAMMPAQYMQPQSATSGVFPPAPMYQPAPAYPHQLYQHHNYGTQAGGVTYYSCAEQETASRPHRRPTAAIPIVKPNHAELGQERPANSSEKDNIDRIVENMFVRKPWPGTAANDPSKDKSERSSQEPQSTSQPSSLTSSVSSDSKTEKTEKETTKEKEPERTEDA